MADQHGGPRDAEDESRVPGPGEGTKPLPAEAAPHQTTAEPGSGSAAGSGVGSAGQSTFQAPGYAYGPGGAGWSAPGWRPAAGQGGPGVPGGPPAGPGGAFGASRPRPTDTNRLVIVGLVCAVVGALFGGGVVAVGDALWHRFHGPRYGVVWSNPDQGPRRMPRDGQNGPRFGQDRPSDDQFRFCRWTEAGFRCDGPGAVPDRGPAS
jgi:hypothetical protein